MNSPGQAALVQIIVVERAAIQKELSSLTPGTPQYLSVILDGVVRAINAVPTAEANATAAATATLAFQSSTIGTLPALSYAVNVPSYTGEVRIAELPDGERRPRCFRSQAGV